MTNIALKYDMSLDVATAASRLSKHWKNRKWQWSELVNKCTQTRRTEETMAEYIAMGRELQGDIKDVGGFVGGYLAEGLRKTGNVRHRSMATLDIDYGTPDVWEDFTMNFNCAAMLYSTHKHTTDKPRLRLVIPFNRDVQPVEYEPICRRIADSLGIELFDTTTYELSRLFYWPSTCKNGDYVFEYLDAPALDADEILGTYVDPFDASSWPMAGRESEMVKHTIIKAGNPTEKTGLIGAFCRVYSIEDAIEKFLPDIYERTATDGRYTYKQGSVAGGLVCYDHIFAYSHHDTDPAGRQLCNAFDLCRIHLFGSEDEKNRQEDVTKRPSYNKMLDFAGEDSGVRVMLAEERLRSVNDDFAGIVGGDNEEAPKDKEMDFSWTKDLETDKRGSIKSTACNVILIIENDQRLKDHLWHDEFSGFDLVANGLPWNKAATQWGDKDDANLRVYMEKGYGIMGKDKIKDAKDAVLTRHRRHPIKEYLKSLKWDGTPRLERLIIDYMGAEDNLLNRTMTRIHFTAAVARVMNPGCKYDYCLIMQGAEGIGKSTLLNIMGGEWFNDSITTTDGKEGMEQLQRAWIVELAELSSIKRSEVDQVKTYISRQDDIYRQAYGSTVQKRPRHCVFCGTTNEDYFLKGDTGNRRFWVIQVDASLRRYGDNLGQIKKDRDQLWAEAVVLWKKGQRLYLPQDLEMEARNRQSQFNDNNDDPLADIVKLFLETKLPTDWDTWDLQRRRAHYADPDPLDSESIVERTRVCAAEIICERMKHDMAEKDFKYIARKVGRIMDDMPGWERTSSTRHVENLYGRQRGWKRIDAEKREEEDNL